MNFDLKDSGKFGGGISESYENINDSGIENNDNDDIFDPILNPMNNRIKKNLESEIISPSSAILNAQSKVIAFIKKKKFNC